MVLAAPVATSFAFADDDQAKLRRLMAAYLYNFLQFTEFSKDQDLGSIRVCFYGEQSENEAFQPLAAKFVKDRPIEIAYVSNKLEAAGCNTMFFYEWQLKEFSMLAPYLKDLGVITFGENPKFLDLGGVVNFFIEDGKLRFDINRNNSPSDTKFSSKLLRLANQVFD